MGKKWDGHTLSTRPVLNIVVLTYLFTRGKHDKTFCKICTADAGIRCMKILMSLLPMPGKNRLSAEEAFKKIYYLSPVELLVYVVLLLTKVSPKAKTRHSK